MVSLMLGALQTQILHFPDRTLGKLLVADYIQRTFFQSSQHPKNFAFRVISQTMDEGTFWVCLGCKKEWKSKPGDSQKEWNSKPGDSQKDPHSQRTGEKSNEKEEGGCKMNKVSTFMSCPWTVCVLST